MLYLLMLYPGDFITMSPASSRL